MVAKKQAEAGPLTVDEVKAVEEDQPVPELRHPSAPNYVLRDGQWVYEEPQPETEPELEKSEE